MSGSSEARVDATGPAPELSPSAARSPGLAARLGLAVIHPRWALTVAGDRRYAGRSGTDLIVAIIVLLAATQMRRLATGIWLGTAVEPALGLRAVVHVLSGALTVTLGLLVLGAGAVFAAAGPRRNLGRAFDLACVAALPMTVVDLIATVAVRTAGLAPTPFVSWLLSGLAYAWMGALIVVSAQLAARTARTRPVRSPTTSRSRRAAARSPCSTSGPPGAARAWRRCRGSRSLRARTPTCPSSRSTSTTPPRRAPCSTSAATR
jgi:hypothetical protein